MHARVRIRVDARVPGDDLTHNPPKCANTDYFATRSAPCYALLDPATHLLPNAAVWLILLLCAAHACLQITVPQALPAVREAPHPHMASLISLLLLRTFCLVPP